VACAQEQQGCVYHHGDCCGGLTCHCDPSGNPVPPTYAGPRTCCPGDDSSSPAPSGATGGSTILPVSGTDPVAGVTAWVSKNPILALGGALAIGMLLRR
jgi:hypothetical protein